MVLEVVDMDGFLKNGDDQGASLATDFKQSK
jgi:hypothetical protein